MNKQELLQLLKQVDESVLQKQIVVSRYPQLAEETLDELLEIDEVFPENELDMIYKRFQPYLGQYGVFPFLGILGGNVIAIGNTSANHEQIYYYDFDFGMFELDSTLEEFLDRLVTKT